jgi:hypothetical protein
MGHLAGYLAWLRCLPPAARQLDAPTRLLSA